MSVRPSWLSVVLACVLTGGCLTTSPREFGYMLGTFAGAATGIPIGPVLGAAAGTLLGRAIEAPMERRRIERERDTLEQDLGVTSPTQQAAAVTGSLDDALDSTRTPRVERVWIDERMSDGQVVPGRFEEWGVTTGRQHHASSSGQAS